MPKMINVTNNPNSYKDFTIDGNLYYFWPRWNIRTGTTLEDGTMTGAWELTIYKNEFPTDTEDTRNLIVAGRQIVPWQSLFDNLELEDIFTGKLICIDTSPIKGEDYITRENFGVGNRFQLSYWADGEL
ncbi:hypothetical protein NVP1101O_152 [Vibrio phage 1.101.O._10N.261.45.C6]|nr:hypothetical protein NVP1101O_152 [Vibrio phage 1.101.O._10N.261.45.C6]